MSGVRVCGLALAASVQIAAGRDTSFTMVARTDRNYATLGGVQLRHVSPYPVIGPDGTAIFTGVLDGTNVDVFITVSPADEGPRVRAGGVIPAPGGGMFSIFDMPRGVGDGEAAFFSTVGNYDGGVFVTSPAGVVVETRVGQPLVGVPTGSVYSGLSRFAQFSDHLVFTACYGPQVGVIAGMGVWSNWGGQTTLLARGGMQAPGFPPGMNFSPLAFVTYPPVINASGQVAFWGSLPPIVQGIWLATAGQTSLVVREHVAIPGLAGDAFFGLTTPSINAAGTVAFGAWLRDIGQDPPSEPDRSGIWMSRGGAIETVAMMGQTAPGTTATFAGFNLLPYFDLADNDLVAFVARLAGPGVTNQNDKGIWVGSPGNLRLVARTGSQAAGYPPGTTYAFLNLGMELNAKGQLIFNAAVSGANTVENRGLFYATPYGPTQLLLRGHQTITPVGEPPITVYSIHSLQEAGGQDGQPACLNDAGQFVCYADLVVSPTGPGAGSAILVVTLPDVCYANCDASTLAPILNINDFTCFMTRFAAGDTAANCDGSAAPPVLNVDDYLCFLNRYSAGCP